MLSRESLVFIKSLISRVRLNADEPDLVGAATAIAKARDEVNKELESAKETDNAEAAQ